MDAQELEDLYRTYRDPLVRSLQKRFMLSGELVEDGVQEAFLRLHQLPLVPDEPRAWLRTVAKNYVLDRLKEQGKHGRADLIDNLADPGQASTTSSAKATPSLVLRGLTLLTSRAQRLLRGKYQEDKTYGTLAREEGLAKSGMGRILDRARERLRRAVAELRT